MITIDNLPTMSVYEKNIAVAVKAGFNIVASNKHGIVIQNENGSRKYFEPCNNPRDYMPLAIKHGISLEFIAGIVIATWMVKNKLRTYDKFNTEEYCPNKAGEAVVDAVLLMGIHK